MKQKSTVLTIILLVLQSYSFLWAMPTTQQQAETVVQGWLKADPQPLDTSIGREIGDVETFRDDFGDPIYYVVYLKPSGFVIVSADDLVEPIIGFVDSGTYDPSLENPLGALVTNDLNGRIAAVRNTIKPLSTTIQTAETKTQKKWNQFIDLANTNITLMNEDPLCDGSPSDVRVAPFVQSKWNQRNVNNRACFNYYTPQILPGGELSWDKGNDYYGHIGNYHAGCAATAMVQLMRYYEYPKEAPIQPDPTDPDNTVGVGQKDPNGAYIPIFSNLYRSLLGGDENGGKYEWDKMVLVPDTSTTLEKIKAIGTICHDAGVAAKMKYTSDGSSTSTLNAAQALITNFSYKNVIYGSNGNSNLGSGLIGMVHPNLDSKRPVILGIHGEGGGHGVICDGYGFNTSTLYHHLNMGWSGSDDCWYNLPIIECPEQGYRFIIISQCIYNVFEDNEGEIISGRVLQDDDRPAAGAIVYRVSSDGSEPCEVYTDNKGIYFFDNLDSNTTYTIWASVDGMDFPVREVTTGISQDRMSFSGNRWAVDFPQSENILYVDQDATASDNDGSSWNNAFIDLQDAIEAAINSPGQDDEIWVAAGTYKPDAGTGNRAMSFELVDGLGIYGGFAGGETQRQQRNPDINITMLSGDLNGDDGGNFTNINENSYHVVNGSRISNTGIIDGFTITGGNADGEFANSVGGGIFISGANPTVTNCTFSKNSADWGGGIFNDNSSPVLNNCKFIENVALTAGGGIHGQNNSNIEITGGEFNSNSATYGGGIQNSGSNLVISDCSFSNNSATYGGGMRNYESNPTLIQCIFSENSATEYGGGILNNNSSPILTDCTFIANSAPRGGGMRNSEGSDPALTRCIFNSNRAEWGAGMYNYGGSPTLINCNLIRNEVSSSGGAIYNNTGSISTLTNCIVWGNTERQIRSSGGGSAVATYSDIQGGWEGEGNINEDPLFADPDNGDYHLKSQAGRWDPVSESWIIDDVTSPCIDAGNPGSSAADEPAPNGDKINMGAYGGTTEASKSFIN